MTWLEFPAYGSSKIAVERLKVDNINPVIMKSPGIAGSESREALCLEHGANDCPDLFVDFLTIHSLL